MSSKVNDIFKDVIELDESLSEKNTTEIHMIHERLKNFDPVNGENNIQNLPANPGPSSRLKTKSEIYNNGFDNMSKSKIQNFSMEYKNNEIINIPSDSDDDQNYNNNTSDLNDVAIINTIKKEVNDTASSNLPSYPTDDFSSDPLLDMPIVPIPSSSNDREATSVSNKDQDRPQVEIVEENNNVSYTTRLSEDPRPGCSKDFDDTPASKVESRASLEEILKDTRLLHALLPTYNIQLIFDALCNNKYAKNHIELSLWDLLPVERPPPQLARKRKSLDNMYIIERKKNLTPNLFQQKDYTDTETAMEKKERIMNIKKLEDRAFVSSMDEIDRMKWNIPEVTVLNDTNNDRPIIDQSAMKTKLDRTLGEPMYIEHDNDINMNVVQDFKKSVSSKTNSKTKELQSIKNSKIKKKSKSLSDNKTKFPVAVTTVLQPAKLTLEANFMQSSQKIGTFYKPPTPILSPPKLHFIKNDELHLQQMSTLVQQMKQNNGRIVFNENDSSVYRIRLPGTSSNDKKASHIDVPKSSNSTWPKLTLLQSLSDFARDMETEDTKSVNVYTTRVVAEPSFDRPSYSQALCNSKHNNRASNISDHQGANSSKTYNFNQEAGDMNTSQVYRRKNEKVRMLSLYFA